jgi:hypothetical protein
MQDANVFAYMVAYFITAVSYASKMVTTLTTGVDPGKLYSCEEKYGICILCKYLRPKVLVAYEQLMNELNI